MNSLSDLLKPFAMAIAIILGVELAEILFHLEISKIELPDVGAGAGSRLTQAGRQSSANSPSLAQNSVNNAFHHRFSVASATAFRLCAMHNTAWC